MKISLIFAAAADNDDDDDGDDKDELDDNDDVDDDDDKDDDDDDDFQVNSLPPPNCRWEPTDHGVITFHLCLFHFKFRWYQLYQVWLVGGDGVALSCCVVFLRHTLFWWEDGSSSKKLFGQFLV